MSPSTAGVSVERPKRNVDSGEFESFLRSIRNPRGSWLRYVAIPQDVRQILIGQGFSGLRFVMKADAVAAHLSSGPEGCASTMRQGARSTAYDGFIHFYDHHRPHGTLSWATLTSILKDSLPKEHA